MDTIRVFSYNPGLQYSLLFLAIGLLVTYAGSSSGVSNPVILGGQALSFLSLLLIIRSLFLKRNITFEREYLVLPAGIGRMFPKLISFDSIIKIQPVGNVFPSKVLRILTKSKTYEISAYLLESDEQYHEINALINEKIA